MKQKIIRPAFAFILLVSLCLLVKCVKAQNPPQKVNNWYEYKALSADSGLNPPQNFSAPGHFYRRSGAMVYNTADSSWYVWTGSQLLPVKKAQNGLTDSLGRFLLGGNLYKNTVVNTQLNSLFLRVPSNPHTTPQVVMGNAGAAVSHNGFDPPIIFSDSLSYVGNNSPFCEMSSIDYPGPNGLLFLNFQSVNDSPQVDIRVFTPTHFESTLSMDLNGLPNTNPYTSAYDIFFYGDLTGGQSFGMTGSNFAAWHNGPCCFLNPPYGMTFMQDQNFNVLIGPGRDTTVSVGPFTVGYAIPYGRLDIRPSPTNSGHLGVFEQDPTDTSRFAGGIRIGLNSATTGQGFIGNAHYTTIQKLALTGMVEGDQVYDITLHKMSYWNGTTWINF